MNKKLLSLVLITLCIVTFLFSESFPQTKAKKIIYMTEKKADLPFSPAILVKDTLYISGQLASNPQTGKFEEGTMAQQAERIIKNIEILLRRAGMNLSNVVQSTVFITNFDEFGEFNNIFREYFPEDPPTRATVQVVKLARNAKIEMAAVAVK